MSFLRAKKKNLTFVKWGAVAGVVQSVQRLPTGCTVRGTNPSEGGARPSVSVQTGKEAYPTSRTMGTGSFPGVSAAEALF